MDFRWLKAIMYYVRVGDESSKHQIMSNKFNDSS